MEGARGFSAVLLLDSAFPGHAGENCGKGKRRSGRSRRLCRAEGRGSRPGPGRQLPPAASLRAGARRFRAQPAPRGRKAAPAASPTPRAGSRRGGTVPGRSVQLPDRPPVAPFRRGGSMDANLRFWRAEGQVRVWGSRGGRAGRDNPGVTPRLLKRVSVSLFSRGFFFGRTSWIPCCS